MRALSAPGAQPNSATRANPTGQGNATSPITQERAEAAQRQRLMNAIGVRDGATQNQVEEAVDKLSRDGKVSRDTARNAATEAGADAKRIANAYGGDLNKAAHETGKANAGELVGSLAEERLRNEGKIARDTPAVFGEPIMAGTIAGILNDLIHPNGVARIASSNPSAMPNKPSSQQKCHSCC
ncbi:MAG: hypothetical protein HC853_15750, partial [Anaerolineae bacterium]|nr:hypothetical protein [Anaerolineae bacterium]